MNSKGKNVHLVGHCDVEGGGQVIVQHIDEKYYAYVGHMKGVGTSIIDVTNPKKPEILAKISIPPNTHSHKVGVTGDYLFVNNEQLGRATPFQAGLRIFDVSNRSNPREIGFFQTGGRGVHRFWIDGKKQLAYITPGYKGYLNRILMILDISNPSKPEEVSRWWLPGQWLEGGEKPSWNVTEDKVQAHGPPIPLGDRIYLGYWDAGFVILDASDIEQLNLICHMNYHPPYAGSTHTALPIKRKIMGRKWLVLTEEALADKCQEMERRMWMVDITEEKNPVSVSTFQVSKDGFCEAGGCFGPHQPYEDVDVKDNLIYLTYFNAGLRVVDISNPYYLKEVGYYISQTPEGQETIQTNDVYIDDRDFIYIIDRFNGGVDILKYTGPRK